MKAEHEWDDPPPSERGHPNYPIPALNMFNLTVDREIENHCFPHLNSMLCILYWTNKEIRPTHFLSFKSLRACCPRIHTHQIV